MAPLVFLFKHDARILCLNARLASVLVTIFAFLFVPQGARASKANICNPLIEQFNKLPEADQKLIAKTVHDLCKDSQNKDCFVTHMEIYLKQYHSREKVLSVQMELLTKRIMGLPPADRKRLEDTVKRLCGPNREANEECFIQQLEKLIASHEENAAAAAARASLSKKPAANERSTNPNPSQTPISSPQALVNEKYDLAKTRFDALGKAERDIITADLIKLCGPRMNLNPECYKSQLPVVLERYDAKMAARQSAERRQRAQARSSADAHDLSLPKDQRKRYEDAHNRYSKLSSVEKEKVEARLKEVCADKPSLAECYTRMLPDVMDEFESLSAGTRMKPAKIPKPTNHEPIDELKPSEPQPPVLHHGENPDGDALVNLKKFNTFAPVRYEEIHPAANHPSVSSENFLDERKHLPQYRVSFEPLHHQLVSDIYRPHIKPFDTRGSRVRKDDTASPEGRALWITTLDTRRVIVPNPWQADYNFISVTRGKPIGAGGEVVVENGFVKRMNNRTWPYYPNSEKGLLAEARRIAQDITRARHIERAYIIEADGKKRLYTITTGYNVDLKVAKVTEEEGGRVIEVEFIYTPYEIKKKIDTGG